MKPRIKHGHATREAGESPEYRCRYNMITRCMPLSPDRANYADRGISVCQRWLDSFSNFLADMGPRPSPDHSIERIDNDRGYEPGNCRWATRAEQGANKRTNRLITAGGETLTLKQWSDRTGINKQTLRGRLRIGWPDEKVVGEPVDPQRAQARLKVAS